MSATDGAWLEPPGVKSRRDAKAAGPFLERDFGRLEEWAPPEYDHLGPVAYKGHAEGNGGQDERPSVEGDPDVRMDDARRHIAPDDIERQDGNGWPEP